MLKNLFLYLKKSKSYAVGMLCLPHNFFLTASFLFYLILPLTFLYPDSVEDVLSKTGFSIGETEKIINIFETASEYDIPDELLIPRLQEGIAKNIPPERITEGLKKSMNDLIHSKKILENIPCSIPQEKYKQFRLRTAHLISYGMPEDIIKAIASESCKQNKDYLKATSLYVSLTDWGIKPEQSLNLVTVILQSRISEESYLDIPLLFSEGRRMHISPDEIIERINREIGDSGDIHHLKEMIIY